MSNRVKPPVLAGEEPETRLRIVYAAQRLFMERGFDATSTRQIAAACGLTQPALYRHFATKQELYVAVLLEMLEHLHDQLAPITRGTTSVSERLRAVARLLPATWLDTSQLFHDIEHALEAAHQRTVSVAFRALVVKPIASLFEEGIAQGLLREPSQGGLEPSEATFVLFRLLDDHAVPQLQQRSRSEHADTMVSLLLRGLLLNAQA